MARPPVPTFFGINFQTEIDKAFPASQMPKFILKKSIPSGRTDSLGGVHPVYTDYLCHGSMVEYKLEEIDNTEIQKGDIKIILIAKPLQDKSIEPEMDDLISDGEKTYTIVDIPFRDAGKATYHCHCRG